MSKHNIWKFQSPETIIKYIQNENLQDKSHDSQSHFLLRKLNICFLYFISTKLNSISIYFDKKSQTKERFIFVESIQKETITNSQKEIITIFEMKTLYKQLKKYERSHRRKIQIKIQLQQLSKIIQDETGMKFEFDKSVNNLELLSFIDENSKQLDLLKFIEENDHFEELIEIMDLKKKEKRRREIEKNMKMEEESNSDDNDNEDESSEHSENEISSDDDENTLSPIHQISENKRIFNCALIYYILTTCPDYVIIHDNWSMTTNVFMKIKLILKNNIKIFDINEQELSESKTSRCYQREKIQMKILTDILKKEKEITLSIFVSDKKFEIKEFVDKNGEEIKYDEFIEKYYNHCELIKLLKQQKLQYNSSTNIDKLKGNKGMKKVNQKQISKENKSTQWNYQEPHVIEKILSNEKDQLKSRRNVYSFSKKLNCAMMYYLTTKCEKYSFYHFYREKNAQKEFIYIKRIMKDNTILYDSDEIIFPSTLKSLTSQLNFKRNKQLEKLAELIHKETGMKFIFSKVIHKYELLKFVDSDGQQLDLIEFLNE